MSVAQSIFEKICPACASIISVTTERCECGYTFTLRQDESHTDQEVALRDEELYENYLAARAAQALEAARAALSELSQNPDDARLAADAALSQEVAKSLEADLNEQRAKIRALQASLPRRPEPAPSPPVMTAPSPAPIPEPVAQGQEGKPAPASMTTIRSPMAGETRSTAAPSESTLSAVSTAVETPAITKPAPQQVSMPASPLISAARAASVLESIKLAKARERADRFVPETPMEAPSTPSVASSAPSPAFRAEQSMRAQQAISHLKALDEKCCPNCTSSVPKNTTRCRCGFAFVAEGNDLPTLTLCTGDFSALRDSFNLNLRRS